MDSAEKYSESEMASKESSAGDGDSYRSGTMVVKVLVVLAAFLVGMGTMYVIRNCTETGVTDGEMKEAGDIGSGGGSPSPQPQTTTPGLQITTPFTTEPTLTDFPTTPTTTTTTTRTTTTTLPPAGPPEISCIYELNELSSATKTLSWPGINICHDVHVRAELDEFGRIVFGGKYYWNITAVTDNHIYFMYIWDEIQNKNFTVLKYHLKNRNRRYSLGWLNTRVLPVVANLQDFINVFKTVSTVEDSGIVLGLEINDNTIKKIRDELLAVTERVSPKFKAFLIKLEDPGYSGCQTFPYWSNTKIPDLLDEKKWPAPVALPVSAAVFLATNNSGTICITFEKDSLGFERLCSTPTEDSVFINSEELLGAETRKSLRKLKKKYRDLRTGNICIHNMEYLDYFTSCLARNESDFLL